MNGGEDAVSGEGSGRLGAFYAYRNTFDESSVWVDVPKTGTLYRPNIYNGYYLVKSPGADGTIGSDLFQCHRSIQYGSNS